MKIKYARHARRQMKWRRIAQEEVEAAITQPNSLEPSIKGRHNAFKLVGGRLLKVTFHREDDIVTVVTVIARKG